MIQYMSWAKAQIDNWKNFKNPSIYDWFNMPLSELSNRALAICAVAKNSNSSQWNDYKPAVMILEKMAKALKEKYPAKKPKGWW